MILVLQPSMIDSENDSCTGAVDDRFYINPSVENGSGGKSACYKYIQAVGFNVFRRPLGRLRKTEKKPSEPERPLETLGIGSCRGAAGLDLRVLKSSGPGDVCCITFFSLLGNRFQFHSMPGWQALRIQHQTRVTAHNTTVNASRKGSMSMMRCRILLGASRTLGEGH